MAKAEKGLIVLLILITFGALGYSIVELSGPVQTKTTRLAELKAQQSSNKEYAVTEEAEKVPLLSDANTCIESFFGVVYTFADQKQFDARQKLAEKYATPDAIKESTAITPDPYRKIEQIQLADKLDNTWFVPTSHTNHTLTGTVLVRYDASKEDNNPGQVEEVYTVTYDQKVGKLTHVKSVGVYHKNSDSQILAD